VVKLVREAGHEPRQDFVQEIALPGAGVQPFPGGVGPYGGGQGIQEFMN